MRARRRVALYIAAFALLCLLLLALAPLLFRGRIEAGVKGAIERNVNARVAWKRVGLGIFRHFPDLTLELDRLAVTGVGRFQGDTLLALPRFGLVLDLGSVLRSLGGSAPVVVEAVELDRPVAHLLVLEDGAASWDILKPSPDTSGRAGRALRLKLRRLELRGGRIAYQDRQSRLTASIAGLSERLSGDFGAQRFTVATRTAADTVSLTFAGVPYLKRVRLDVSAELDVDAAAKRLALKQNRIRINDLALETSGSVAAAPDSSWALDLAFKAPATQFKEILSLVPAIYARDFEALQASGTMAVSGWVRGTYGPRSFPALALAARVENGSFRYPKLPLPAREVFLDLAISNPGGSPDATVMDLKRFHVVLGANPLEGSFALRTPISDPDVDLKLKGRVDLADVGRTVELPDVQQLAGLVAADAAMRARVSDVDARRYDRVAASGSVEVRSLVLRAQTLRRPVQVAEASLQLAPQHARLAAFRGQLGSSDVSATGFIDNLLGYLLRGQELRGQASVRSARFDLNEWRSDDELKAVPVPARLDLALDAAADRLLYGNLTLSHAQGALRVKDRRVTLQDFRLDLLGGAVTMSGFYETTDPARPAFDLAMKVSDVDVPGAFTTLKTVQAFVPVAQYAKGKASAELRLNGALGQDLVPLPGVLSALGSFRTAGLVLQGFPALTLLAEKLKIDQLRDPGFKDLKSSFEIKDGRLNVKPFTTQIGQLALNVAGSNGLDRSLDYDLALRLPRAALGAEANRVVASLVAQSARAGLNLQAADTVTLGVKLTGTVLKPALSTSVRETAGATATAVENALRAEAGRRVDTVKQRVDAAAEEARRRAEAERARLLAEAEQRAAALRQEARTLADRVRQEAATRADSLAARPTGALAKAAARAAADRLRKEADARADRIVREADARADSLVAKARAFTGQ